MDHPEIVEAWRKQRRKNFPSSGNIKLKKLREQAKIDTGLRATEKSYTFKSNKWVVKRHTACIPDDKEPSRPPSPEDPLSSILEPDKESASSSGLLGLGAYNSSDSETETSISKPSINQTDAKPNVELALKKFKQYAKMRAAEGKKKKSKPKWNGIMKSGRRRHQPTLLYKLLSKDITREHNSVLQCIRYIVNNNFFDNPVNSGDVEYDINQA